MSERGFRRVVAALAVVGAVLSLVALYEHVSIVHHLTRGPSFCAVNAVINCDAVNGSEYSSFLGIPIASYGLFFYLSLFALGISAGWSRGITHRGLMVMTLLAGALSSVISVALFLLSAFVIGAYCLICMGMYLVNFALLGVGELQARKEQSSLYGLHREGVVVLVGYIFGKGTALTAGRRLGPLVVLPLMGALAVGVVMVEPLIVSALSHAPSLREGRPQSALHEESTPHVVDPVEAWQKSELVEFPDLQEEGAYASFSKGPKGAPIQIVEFADFECPACRYLFSALEPVMKEYDGAYRLTFRNYPLDDACNPGIKLHRYACRAAIFARCAGEQGEFWPAAAAMFETHLFESSKDTTQLDKSLLELAERDLHLDRVGIAECLASSRQLDVIRREILDGNRVKLRGTPSIWINGRFVASPKPDTVRKIFDFILKTSEK